MSIYEECLGLPFPEDRWLCIETLQKETSPPHDPPHDPLWLDTSTGRIKTTFISQHTNRAGVWICLILL